MDLLFYFPVITHLRANLSEEEFTEVNRVVNFRENDSTLSDLSNRKISLKELYNLQWRLGEKEPSAFFPPGNPDNPNENCSLSTQNILEAAKQMENLEKKYNWKDSSWKQLEINFSEFTNDNPIKMHLKDNPYDSTRKWIFKVSLPVSLEELIPQINKHFEEVDLPNSPDNGIFDLIKYENGIFEIYTAS